jgi:DNA ligase D-like protein (predicted ligase)/DNA ligase D-like protein (predicted 3'-phosphoesterase)
MMARTAEKPFNDPDWLFEVKWDGIRAIAYVGEDLKIRSRNDKELSKNFPELSELKDLISRVVLDGEIIVMKGGKVDFQLVSQRNQVKNQRDIEYLRAKNPATYVIFDILEKEGKSLIDNPLSERLDILNFSLQSGNFIIKSKPVKENGIDYYEAAIAKGLEGIMAKRSESIYQPGVRSGDWLKIKEVKDCDCVIFGYTPGEGSRSDTFGALLLGLYDNGKPTYIGRVGTGFSDEQLKTIKTTLEKLETNEKWFDEPDIPVGSQWVKPTLVAKIGYQNLTNDERLRAPRFQGFREDKPPELCSINQVKSQSLDEYYRKRDFSKTNEPIGGYEKGTGNSFVIQKHDARRLHWDLRLERDGVLVSWAVPKGIPEEVNERRLAIKTEDHPLDYVDFEGKIPDGHYGAGIVEIWDKGFYVPARWEEDKIEFVLAGKRIKARYELVRFEKAGEDHWLLFKKE